MKQALFLSGQCGSLWHNAKYIRALLQESAIIVQFLLPMLRPCYTTAPMVTQCKTQALPPRFDFHQLHILLDSHPTSQGSQLHISVTLPNQSTSSTPNLHPPLNYQCLWLPTENQGTITACLNAACKPTPIEFYPIFQTRPMKRDGPQKIIRGTWFLSLSICKVHVLIYRQVHYKSVAR